MQEGSSRRSCRSRTCLPTPLCQRQETNDGGGPVAASPGRAGAPPTGQRILGAPRSEASRTYDAAGRPSIKQVALCSARVPLGATHLYDMNKPSDIAAYVALVTTAIGWGGSVVAQKTSLGPSPA